MWVNKLCSVCLEWEASRGQLRCQSPDEQNDIFCGNHAKGWFRGKILVYFKVSKTGSTPRFPWGKAMGLGMRASCLGVKLLGPLGHFSGPHDQASMASNKSSFAWWKCFPRSLLAAFLSCGKPLDMGMRHDGGTLRPPKWRLPFLFVFSPTLKGVCLKHSHRHTDTYCKHTHTHTHAQHGRQLREFVGTWRLEEAYRRG